MYEYKLLIPKERVAILIGDKGKTKRLIESKTNTSLLINNEEVTIMGEESYNAWICEQVIKAIARGFNPRVALRLTIEGYAFELIDIMDYAKNDNAKVRLRGRVIGEEGKTREHIERDTGCKINIFGKTIGVIGPSDSIRTAVEAIDMLLRGSQTSGVYKFLEKQARIKMRKELIS